MGSKVCLISTVHPVFDTRIFYREAMTLSHSGYRVFLIASYNKESIVSGIKILPVSSRKGRIFRILIKGWQAFFRGIRINADIYHFHDPELIPMGIILKLLGKKVIYDVHENVSMQIYSKNWIPIILRRYIAEIFKFIEKIALSFFSGIIVAGEDIMRQTHFRRVSYKVTLLRNFPVVELTEKEVFPKPQNKIIFIYTGIISNDRGILEVIKAFKKIRSVNIRLILLGQFDSNNFKEKILRETQGCNNIKYIPSVSYQEMFDILAKCHVGLMCFKPTPNNIGALSGRNNKIYEYMQAGLAIIGSNFPLWEEFIKGNKIGITVNPYDPSQIKEAMEFFITNPIELDQMEKNAKLLSREFSWGKESEKLIELYKELLNEDKI